MIVWLSAEEQTLTVGLRAGVPVRGKLCGADSFLPPGIQGLNTGRQVCVVVLRPCEPSPQSSGRFSLH